MLRNETNIPLSMAVWLATDFYDHDDDPNTISVTALLKPLRSIILGSRIPGEPEIDLSAQIASAMGTAIHMNIEEAWNKGDFKKSMQKLGYPDSVINRVRINPPNANQENIIPVYMEVRTKKEILGKQISGKFDFVVEGRLADFKSTSTYTAIKKSNDLKYIQQGSIYRWLNPDIITQDEMDIVYLFTDWSAIKAKTDKNYPQSKILVQKFTLMSLIETERFIKNKLNLIAKYIDSSEAEIPLCTKDELWQRDPIFKYYKNPAKKSRSTKNFDNIIDANNRLANDGHVGVVDTIPGEVVFCRYCPAVTNCIQAEGYILSGELKL